MDTGTQSLLNMSSYRRRYTVLRPFHYIKGSMYLGVKASPIYLSVSTDKYNAVNSKLLQSVDFIHQLAKNRMTNKN